MKPHEEWLFKAAQDVESARAAQYPQSIAEQLNHLPAAQNQNTESEI